VEEMQSANELKQNAKKLRKKILITVGAILLSMLAILLLIYYVFLPPEETPEPNYYFYPVTGENIFDTGEYFESDMIITYCANSDGMGLRTEVTEESDSKLRFLSLVIKSVIMGDNQAYRSYFSDAYLAGNTLPQFTQQMLYDICIYNEGTQVQKDGTVLYVYRLDYMIRKNNGTYRRDVGSDMIRPQYVLLSINASNEIKIENIYTQGFH
jgi:hypothetical protein